MSVDVRSVVVGVTAVWLKDELVTSRLIGILLSILLCDPLSRLPTEFKLRLVVTIIGS